MTVYQLINYLKECDPDSPVYIWDDHHEDDFKVSSVVDYVGYVSLCYKAEANDGH